MTKGLITICARGGSKGIPGKNIKKLNGVPLIAYSIKIAQRYAQIYDCKVVLSTDDSEIEKVAKDFGLYGEYKRPYDLGSDQAGKLSVIREVLKFYEINEKINFDYVLDLDVTSPMRTIDDLKKGFELFKRDEQALTLFSVNAAARNPYFNMVEKKENGYYHLVSQKGEISSRQMAPHVYDMNASFYFYKRSMFELDINTVITQHSLIYQMPHECFDLDHPIDFDYLEFLLSNNKLSFEIW